MSITRLVLAAAAAATMSATAAYAADPPARAATTELYVCDLADVPKHLRRAAFASRQFVTAEQALAGAAWRGAPRCIKPAELERLKLMRPTALREMRVASATR